MKFLEAPAIMGGQSTSGTPDITWGCQQDAAMSSQQMYDVNQGVLTIPPVVTVSGVPADKQAKVTFFPEGSVSPPGFSPSLPTILVQVDG